MKALFIAVLLSAIACGGSEKSIHIPAGAVLVVQVTRNGQPTNDYGCGGSIDTKTKVGDIQCSAVGASPWHVTGPFVIADNLDSGGSLVVSAQGFSMTMKPDSITVGGVKTEGWTGDGAVTLPNQSAGASGFAEAWPK